MTDLSRGDRVRRSGRRPGWLLLTVLLVLAIAASSALVFTNRVELLKLAVILSLWAAVVGAFVSVIYRRQSDADQAKVRDLKMVYDLQLDREISARREYELNVETHLRRELAGEMRAQSSDEVAALRAELSALRTTLEILFDTDLAHRPALETDRGFAEWTGDAMGRPDRVASSRVHVVRDEDEPRTAESPIIDVPEEPLTPAPPPQPAVRYEPPEEVRQRVSHRRPTEAEETRWIPPVTAQTPPLAPQPAAQPVPPPPPPAPQPANWMPPPPPVSQPSAPAPPPPAQPAQNGHATAAGVSERRGRHSVPAETPSEQDTESPAPAMPSVPPPRHRGAEDDDATGGQSVAELLARLRQSDTGGGGRRRRRED